MFDKTQTAHRAREVAIFIVASMCGLAVLMLAWLEGFADLKILEVLLILASAIGITGLPLQIRYPTTFGHYGRMFYHVIGGPLLVYVAGESRATALSLLLSLLVIFGSLALLELCGISSIFSGAKTKYVVSDKIILGPTHYQSGTYWLIGSLILLVFFQPPVALASILIFTLGDGAAGLAGDLLRKRRSGTYVKSVEGSIAFFVVAAIASSTYVGLPYAMMSSAVAALVEALPLPVDDNITVPSTAGLMLTFLKLLKL